MAAAKIQALFRGNKDRKDNRNKVHKLNRRLSKVREDFKRREQAALQKRVSNNGPVNVAPDACLTLARLVGWVSAVQDDAGGASRV